MKLIALLALAPTQVLLAKGVGDDTPDPWTQAATMANTVPSSFKDDINALRAKLDLEDAGVMIPKLESAEAGFKRSHPDMHKTLGLPNVAELHGRLTQAQAAFQDTQSTKASTIARGIYLDVCRALQTIHDLQEIRDRF